MSRARAVIRGMSAYSLVPVPAEEKLDQNESPFDVPQWFKDEVVRRVAAKSWNRYPDFETTRLRAALAREYGVSSDEVLAGNGSNELLLATLTTFAGPGVQVILPAPTFALYAKIAAVAGADIVPVPVDPASGGLPVDGILDAIARAPFPPVVVLCSPNNPTGGALRAGELQQILDSGATVLLDRAYGEFVPDSLPPLASNLVVLSTFSKAWGIAGLRVGWLLSTAENCREIRKVKLPYNLNLFSEEAAILLLENRELRVQHVAHVRDERARMTDAMSRIDGVTPFPSSANFIAFSVTAPPRDVFDALARRGVLVRDISSYTGLGDALRVSVGTNAQNDRFLAALAESMRELR